ncbi:MAG: DUF2147 domain-containing protein [Pseudomonadota bacterium]
MTKTSLLLLSAATLFATTPAMAAAPIGGKWVTAEKDSIIEIAPCGTNMCGKISKFLTPVQGPPFDRNNPDAKLKNRPLLGLPILLALKDGGKQWEGNIYDPKKGKTYKSKVYMNPNGTMTVKGCIAFFCQAFVWTAAR